LPAGVSGPLLPATGGLSIAGSLGPLAAIGGGAFGIYSGIQKGGIGGAVGAAGGAVSTATGLGMLGAAAGLLPVLGVLGPIGLALGPARALASAFLPGQKASSRRQDATINTEDGAERFGGLFGRRFSQANMDAATSKARGIADLETTLQGQLGFGVNTEISAGVTSGREDGDAGKTHLRVGDQGAEFANDEAGAKAFGEKAAEFLLKEFKAVSEGQGDKGSIVRASSTLRSLAITLTGSRAPTRP